MMIIFLISITSFDNIVTASPNKRGVIKFIPTASIITTKAMINLFNSNLVYFNNNL